MEESIIMFNFAAYNNKILKNMADNNEFRNLNIKQLWALRRNVILGDARVPNIKDTFGFEPIRVHSFFHFYLEYLFKMSDELFGLNCSESFVEKQLDNAAALWMFYKFEKGVETFF